MEKACGICKTIKPITEFYKKAYRFKKYENSIAGYAHACRTCSVESSKQNPNRKQNDRRFYQTAHRKLSLKDSFLKRNFGISLEDYNRMFIAQNGCCLICKQHQSSLKRALAVDHCHETKKVRGLLCCNCNAALGYMKENKEWIHNMNSYLTNSELAVSNVLEEIPVREDGYLYC